ncbi:GATA transcription factor 9-like [Neltuma alba]|uniref:GATA transcription factor 9-like n=1 Tax=Neltuma alba TaxID=207710 RepID=UPI0010A42BD2|nr:GATA transcription factor 9-like [Prosopis alba]
MDVCRNASVAGDCEQEQVILSSCPKLSAFSTTLDDLFSSHNTEVDVGLEWLSVFVEDCFSSPACCLLAPTDVQNTEANSKPSVQLQRTQQKQSPLQNFVVPGKARSKRKRLSAPRTKGPLGSWSRHLNPQNEPITSDPPLLKQAYWLADSELMVPKKEDEQVAAKDGEAEREVEEKRTVRKKESFERLVPECEEGSNGQNQMPRRCTHCLSQRTPQWRAGPLGPKTLCNACGVRYKSGRLLPEYRPAKSPTFVSYLHSNSHKKVMEMRMAVLSSVSSED